MLSCSLPHWLVAQEEATAPDEPPVEEVVDVDDEEMVTAPVQLTALGHDVSQLPVSYLQEIIQRLVGDDQLADAVPYLTELINRLEDSPPASQGPLEGLYFYLGLGYMQSYGVSGSANLTKAITLGFDRYEERFPDGERIHFVLMNRGDCYRALGKFTEAAENFGQLLSPPISLKYGDEKFRLDALEKISSCYSSLNDWEGGTPWFKQLLGEARNPDTKALAASLLMRGYIELDLFDHMMNLLPYLVGDTPARYDVAFNFTLIKGGDKLQKNDRISEASLLYYLALTSEEILAYYQQRLAQLKEQHTLLAETNPDSKRVKEKETEIFNTEQQVLRMAKLDSYTADLKWRKAQIFMLMMRYPEAYWGFWRLVDEYPEHENIEDYYYAAFSQAIKADMTNRVIDIGSQYLAVDEFGKHANDISVQLADKYVEVKAYDKFFALAANYVKWYPKDPGTAHMIYLIGNTRLSLEQFDELIEQFNGYTEQYPDSTLVEGFVYWVGMANLFEGEFEQATDYFKRVINDYPKSAGAYREDAEFRYGVCRFGVDDFDLAYKVFQDFAKKYPDSVLRGEAEIFMGDISANNAEVAVALHHYNTAEQHIIQRNQSMVFVDYAVFQRVQLLEANHLYKKMATELEGYMDRYYDTGNISRAVFELGRVKEFLNKPEEMMEAYVQAIQRFGNQPYSYGVDKILTAYPVKYEENLEKITTNIEFRKKLINDPEFRKNFLTDRIFQYDVLRDLKSLDSDFKNKALRESEFRDKLFNDAMFRKAQLIQYEDMEAAFPKVNPAEALREIYDAASAADQRTLELRVQMALDNMGVPVDRQLVVTEDDFALASPQTLVWISRKMFEMDPYLGRQALQYVVDNHKSADALLDAILALGQIELQEQNLDAAYDYFRQAEELFPASENIYVAVLRQADILVKKSDIEQAVKVYQTVIHRRDWRGVINAEAQYKIGLAHMESGDYLKAHGFFQRTYVAYPHFRKWAALSYLNSGLCLEKLGKISETRATYKEFLATPGMEEYEAVLYRQIKSRLNTL